eukprot:scaffold394_cov237-Pinguiococcus_pyrenoidosus.AAC.5
MSPAGGKRYGSKRCVAKSVTICAANAVLSADSKGSGAMLIVLLKASAASSFASGPQPLGQPLPLTA